VESLGNLAQSSSRKWRFGSKQQNTGLKKLDLESVHFQSVDEKQMTGQSCESVAGPLWEAETGNPAITEFLWLETMMEDMTGRKKSRTKVVKSIS